MSYCQDLTPFLLFPPPRHVPPNRGYLPAGRGLVHRFSGTSPPITSQYQQITGLLLTLLHKPGRMAAM
jgi:hypothetical protein